MGHLGETFAKYKDKGLYVVALTNEPRGLVDKFVSDTKATHPIVIEEGDSLPAYDGKGYPTMVLIGANGKVLATGGVGDHQIEEALKSAIVPPTLTGKAAAAQPLIDKRKFADARAVLAKLAENGTDDEKANAAAGVEWIDGVAKRRMESATSDLASGDVAAAAESYETVQSQFKGLPAADEAAKALKDLLADPAKKKEVDAAKRWEDVLEKIRGEKPKKAIPVLKGFLNSFKGTKAADAAQKALDKLLASEK